MTLRRTVALTSCLAVASLGSLTACGSDDDGSSAPEAGSSESSGPSASSTSASGAGESTAPSTGGSASGSGSVGATAAPTTQEPGVTIRIRFDGDRVTPNGDRVEVPVGEDVRLLVTADEPGEIHVHSTPEQELDYPSGRYELTITDLDQPGIVEVESHALDKVIVQLQVQ